MRLVVGMDGKRTENRDSLEDILILLIMNLLKEGIQQLVSKQSYRQIVIITQSQSNNFFTYFFKKISNYFRNRRAN